MPQDREVYEFAPFVLDVGERSLQRDGQPVAVAPKVLDVLVALIRRHGRMLSRSELLDLVWPGTFVEEESLTRTVSRLRKVLGDARGRPRFVETVSKGGYRFAAPVVTSALRPAGIGFAVLPFKRLGVPPEQEYLGIGIADAIITQLSQVRELTVRPTSSVVRFDHREQDAVSAGRDLRVDWVLDGRVHQEGERLRVTVQLVNTSSADTFWAAVFEEEQARLLDLQDQVATRIIAAILPHLSESGFRTRRFTLNPRAHVHYLRGVHQMYRLSEDGFGKAIDELTRAIDADPEYPLPHAALALMYLIAGDSFILPREAWDRSRAHVTKALESDPLLGEAHSSRGAIRFWLGYEREGAERDYRRGIELSPGSSFAHAACGWYLTAMGRFEEAERLLRRGLELDPLSLPVNADQSLPLYFSGRYREAIDRLHQAIGMEPQYWYGHVWLGLAQLELGQVDRALDTLEAASEQSRGTDPSIGALRALALTRAGGTEEARDIVAELEDLPIVPWYDLAAVRLALNEPDETFRALEQACEERSKWVGWMRVDPRFNTIREHPRFALVSRRAGFRP